MNLLRSLHLRLVPRAALIVTFALGAHSSMQAMDSPTVLVNYPSGFNGATGLQVNGAATFKNGAIQLTNGGQFQAGSVFTTARISSYYFVSEFDFQLTDATADGFAFVMQSTGPDALGSSGGGVGYGNPPAYAGPQIVASNAVVFDLHNNQGEGSNSVRVEQNGITSPANSFDLTPYGLDLHSGHRFHVIVNSYSTSAPSGIAITDTVTNITATIPTYLFNFINGGTGYIGFTGATGSGTATQSILNWTYTSYTPSLYCCSNPGPADLSFPNGFSGASGLKFNGGATIAKNVLQLTHGTQFETTSVFSTKEIDVGFNGFDTDFDFNLSDGSGDGFAFVVQDQSPSALGTSGGGLGYGPDHPGAPGYKIGMSQAVKFDLHNNAGEGSNSTGFYQAGASPTVPSIDLTPSGIDLHNGHTFHAHLTFTYLAPYDEDNFTSSVVVTITDLDVYKVFQKKIPLDSTKLDIANLAYAGFTAGTGETPSSIQILNWRFRAVPRD